LKAQNQYCAVKANTNEMIIPSTCLRLADK
jgi:hypothetical protein